MLEAMPLVRIVSTEDALDTVAIPAETTLLRVAPDEALVLGTSDPADVTIADAHAIVVLDQGWRGELLSKTTAQRLLSAHATWDLPDDVPALAQGRIGNAPVKLWVDADEVLLLLPHVAADDLQKLMAP